MPLLGSYGGSSEYAYRGTLDDFPDDFSFINQSDKIPGELITSNQVTITGINNRALVRVSAGASVSINGGPYITPTEESPAFIRNNETLSARVQLTSGEVTDFNKIYSINVTVGKKTSPWQVRTQNIDIDPTPFTFTNITNGEIGVGYTSNEVTISGLEPGFDFLASITSGSGQIIKNGAPGVPSVTVVNGDRIYLRILAPFEYSEFPTGSGVKTNRTTVQVGSYSTSWSVSSRNVDLFIEPFDFIDVNDALIESVYTAQSVNTLGIVTTITGADQGIPLVTAVSGCELQVDQPAASGGFTIRRPFSTQNAVVFNGDKLTVRITTGSNFSETKVGIVTVSNFTGRFIVTTRPRPIDTIPEQFQFTDLTNQRRNVVVESDEITLVGMTTFTDEGDASITTGTNGGNAQFQVTRGSTVIRPFGNTATKVRNGDKIKLRITTSPDSGISRTATFRVDGIDTFRILTGRTAFIDDIWSVTSAVKVCDITPFTLETRTNANLSSTQTISFVVDGFESDCNMTVRTSDPNSFLSAAGQSGSSITVLPGAVVTLSMTAPNTFSTTRTTTVLVSNPGTDPVRTYSTDWSITTRVDNTPATVTLTASSSLVASGSPVTLTWTSSNAERVISTTGDGFTTTALSGSITINPTVSQNYSITIEPKLAAQNFPNPVTSPPVFISVIDPVINPFTLQNQTNVELNTIVEQSFIIDGFQSNSQVRVSTSNPNSSLRVGTITGNNLSVTPGQQVTVRLGSSSSFNQTTTTTIRATNSGSGLSPVLDYSTNWSVTTKGDSTPASVTLTAQPTQVAPNGPVTLTWSSVNASSVVSTNGFNTSSLSGSTTVFPSSDQTYSISVLPNQSASNFPINQTASVTVTTVKLTPFAFAFAPPDNLSAPNGDLTNQTSSSQGIFRVVSIADQNFSVLGLTEGAVSTATLTSSNSTAFMEVNGVNAGTSFGVKNNDVIVIKFTNAGGAGQQVSGTLTIGDRSRTFTSTTSECNAATSTLDITSGVTASAKEARVTYQNGTTAVVALYTGVSGSGLNNSVGTSQPATVVRSQISGPAPSALSNKTITESGVTQATVFAVGAGGKGSSSRGGGGGGVAKAVFPVTPGGQISLSCDSSSSSVSYNGSTKVLANAGSPSGPGGTAPTGDSKGSGGSGGPGSTGRGGSAGKVPGTTPAFATATPGSPSPPAVPAPKRIGGSGGGFFVATSEVYTVGNGNDAPASAPSLIQNVGISGRQYGGGGGASPGGGSGAPGVAFYEYSVPGSQASTVSAVINEIVSQFNSQASRPPTLSELKSFYDGFTTISALSTSIGNSLSTSNRASSVQPKCPGGTFP